MLMTKSNRGFFSNQGDLILRLMIRSGQIFNSSELSSMSMLSASFRKIQSKLKELWWWQAFSHSISPWDLLVAIATKVLIGISNYRWMDTLTTIMKLYCMAGYKNKISIRQSSLIHYHRSHLIHRGVVHCWTQICPSFANWKSRLLGFFITTLVISNSKGLSEIPWDIRTWTYQICRTEEKLMLVD